MKKVLSLVVILALLLAAIAAVLANNEVVEITSDSVANLEEFMQVREEIMLEQMGENEKSHRFIIRYTSVAAMQNAETTIQSAFDSGVARNAVERAALESRILALGKVIAGELQENIRLRAPE